MKIINKPKNKHVAKKLPQMRNKILAKKLLPSFLPTYIPNFP